MDENPYRAPIATSERPPPFAREPNRPLAFLCCCFAALFMLMFGAAAQRATWTLAAAIGLGWTILTGVGFGAVGWGMWTGRRSPAAVGACIVLGALIAMFTLVINFAGF